MAEAVDAIVLRGGARAQLCDEQRTLGIGDVVHDRRGKRFAIAPGTDGARYAMRSTPWLERKIDQMSEDDREQSRLHNRAN